MPIRENMRNIIKESENVLLCFVEKEINEEGQYEYTLYKCNIHDDLLPDIRDINLNSLNNYVINKELCPFNPLLTEEDCLEYIESDQINGFNTISIQLEDMASVEPITRISQILSKKIIGYAFIFIQDNQKLTLFRKLTAAHSLKNKKILSLNGRYLNCLTNELFLLDERIDCILYENNMYIINKYNFELFFSYTDTYVNVTNAALDELNDSGIIENFSEFREDCLQRNKLIRKFVKLKKDGLLEIFIANSRDEEKIRNTIRLFDLNIEFIDGKIRYNDVSALSEIVNLIANNYLLSPYSPDKFEAVDKKRK